MQAAELQPWQRCWGQPLPHHCCCRPQSPHCHSSQHCCHQRCCSPRCWQLTGQWPAWSLWRLMGSAQACLLWQQHCPLLGQLCGHRLGLGLGAFWKELPLQRYSQLSRQGPEACLARQQHWPLQGQLCGHHLGLRKGKRHCAQLGCLTLCHQWAPPLGAGQRHSAHQEPHWRCAQDSGPGLQLLQWLPDQQPLQESELEDCWRHPCDCHLPCCCWKCPHDCLSSPPRCCSRSHCCCCPLRCCCRHCLQPVQEKQPWRGHLK